MCFVNPLTALGRPFAPELHPDSRAPMFGSFAGLETGRVRACYDQQVRTAYGWRWLAWEDYAVRDNLGRLVEVQSVGRDITERKALEDALTEARDKAEAAIRKMLASFPAGWQKYPRADWAHAWFSASLEKAGRAADPGRRGMELFKALDKYEAGLKAGE